MTDNHKSLMIKIFTERSCVGVPCDDCPFFIDNGIRTCKLLSAAIINIPTSAFVGVFKDLIENGLITEEECFLEAI